MKTFTTLSVGLACSICLFAGPRETSDAGPARPAPEPPAAVDRASGNLVAFWLQYRDDKKEEPVLVTERYAALMIWYGNDRRFYFYDNRAKTVFKTCDFEVFLNQLNGLPRDILIQRFDTCSVSRTHDMPPERWHDLMRVLEKGHRGWATSKINGSDSEVICYCESSGFHFP